MPKYLFIYRDTVGTRAQLSPEEMQAMMEPWTKWFQKFGSAIVDGGDGLKRTGRIVKPGIVTDGPYVEAKEIIGGFSVIQAEDYDAAAAIARECPIVCSGGNRMIEIREFAGYT
jgi:hypothetical protein